MKNSLRAFTSLLISGLLVMLGFSGTACKDSVEEYGAPSAHYKLKGKIVEQNSDRPVQGIRTVMIKYHDGRYDSFIADTVFTGANGFFDLTVRDYSFDEKFKLLVEDIDGNNNGSYESLEIEIDFAGESYIGGDNNWYSGTATKDLGDVPLKPVEKKSE